MIELITGMAGEPHISSNDDRAFNRANFGKENYILNDSENMKVSVSPTDGSITVNNGSCLWSGMHIRITEPEQLKYSISTGLQTVRVYLHYTKSSETLIESIELVPSLNEIETIDSLGDNTLDAYTLFWSAEIEVTGNTYTIESETYHFSKIPSHSEIEKSIDKASESVGVFELFRGNVVSGKQILLSESFKNFMMIIFVHESGATALIPTFSFASNGNKMHICMVGGGTFTNVDTVFSRLVSARLKVINDKILAVENGTNTTAATGISGSSLGSIVAVYGLGRINK